MLNQSAAVLVVPPEDVGKGYGSQELLAMHLAELKSRMEHANPEVLAEAIAAARALEVGVVRFEAATLEVKRVAGDFTTDVMRMAREEARKLLAAERSAADKIVEQTKSHPYHAGGVSVGPDPNAVPLVSTGGETLGQPATGVTSIVNGGLVVNHPLANEAVPAPTASVAPEGHTTTLDASIPGNEKFVSTNKNPKTRLGK